MNPFIFSPRLVSTKDAANYVLNLYKLESKQVLGILAGIENDLDAALNVLVQNNPALETDFRMLIDLARNAGHAEGRRQDLDTTGAQFRSALPYHIRKQMEAAE